jgi:protein-tyrosine phosphatase
MVKFTTNDTAYLHSLGIAMICDLRSGRERSSEPSALLGRDGVKLLSKDYEMGSSSNKLMAAKTKNEAVVIFGDAYIDFVQTLAPQYKEMFEGLLENKAPLAVNCTAGKDRTGVASALILSVLGVDRADVVADYALSQTFVPPAYYLNQASGATAAQTSPFARLPRPIAEMILGSDPAVMHHALGRIDREFGGPIGLAKKQFGLTDSAIVKLRADYLV